MGYDIRNILYGGEPRSFSVASLFLCGPAVSFHGY